MMMMKEEEEEMKKKTKRFFFLKSKNPTSIGSETSDKEENLAVTRSRKSI